jgi:hypothetical protein
MQTGSFQAQHMLSRPSSIHLYTYICNGNVYIENDLIDWNPQKIKMSVL